MYNNSMKLEIKKIGINGEGIAYDQKKPIFVPGTFPGEVVEATISEKKYCKKPIIVAQVLPLSKNN